MVIAGCELGQDTSVVEARKRQPIARAHSPVRVVFGCSFAYLIVTDNIQIQLAGVFNEDGLLRREEQRATQARIRMGGPRGLEPATSWATVRSGLFSGVALNGPEPCPARVSAASELNYPFLEFDRLGQSSHTKCAQDWGHRFPGAPGGCRQPESTVTESPQTAFTEGHWSRRTQPR